MSSVSPAPKAATAPKSTTAPKAARENRKRKADSRGEDVKPSHRKSARVANKSAGIKASSHLFEQLETLDDDDINSTDHEDFSAHHYLPVSGRTNVVYYATSERKDLCTRRADGTVETQFLQGSILPTPDTTEGSVSTSPNPEAKCAVDATSGTNLPHIAIEGVVGSAAIPQCPQGSVPTAPGPKKKTKLTSLQKTIARAKRFGDIKVPIGTWCAGRSGFHENLVHRPTMAGIFGDPDHGAYSIALSGGYEDNVDRGNSFTFTGEGGKIKEKGKKRGGLCDAKANAPQALTKGNMALLMSCQNGRPVRVIRGEKSSWEGAPNKGYRYDGVSSVVNLVGPYTDGISCTKSVKFGNRTVSLAGRYSSTL